MSSSAAGPLRRSSRLREKDSMLNLAAVSEQGPEDETNPEPPTKRRRKNTSKAWPRNAPQKLARTRGKRKSLSRLPDMPLDVLYEVFPYLHPYDLLHLARTTKAFRALLMSRSAITLWRQSIATVPDLPECPPDLTEPAYTNLLFDPHCHFCVKARVVTVMWICRLRCCKSCLKDNFAELVEVFHAVGRRRIKPGAMLPAEQINNRLFFPKAKLQELLERIAECDEDDAKLKALEEQRIQLMTDQEKNAELLEDWQLKQNHKRALEKLDLRVRRYTQILARLSDLGYAQDFEYMTVELFDKFVEHPSVKQPKELTDRIWNNIKESMLAFAQVARSERLMRERAAEYINRLRVIQHTVSDYLSLHPLWENIPSVADFSRYTPVFRSLMDRERDVFFKEVDLPAEVVKLALTDIVRRWRRDMQWRLYTMIPDDSCPEETELAIKRAAENDALDDRSTESILMALLRATTWFRCTECDCLLDYPRVQAHQCLKTGPAINMDPKTDADDRANAYNIVLKEFPWNYSGNKIFYDMDARAAAQKVVRAYGLDPNGTKGFDMDLDSPRFACGECNKDGSVCVMPWRVAVAHLCKPDHKDKDIKLTLLNDDDRAHVIESEYDWTSAYFRDTYKLWGCVHCRGHAMTMRDVVQHCIVKHDVNVPEEEDDWALHPDAETALGVPAGVMNYPEGPFTTQIQH
ncbi:hypothetical protein LXA43DRAFT_995909 [Ganoderma leucocontextum]|nr:hypothetical protein LXA43DRAFT_995909 [Ganoderma leucocontextum]